MGRYIDADKVLKELHLNYKDVIYIDKNDTARRIEKIPTIDIVRCKSCKHWAYGKDICTLHDMGTLDDDFCSYGEVRDE